MVDSQFRSKQLYSCMEVEEVVPAVFHSPHKQDSEVCKLSTVFLTKSFWVFRRVLKNR